MVLWGLFFLTFLLSSCFDKGTSDNIDALSSEVDQMLACQRKAENRNFYLHKYKAEKIIERCHDKYSSMSDEDQRRFVLGRSKYAFVLSDYLLQVGDRLEAIHVMDELATDNTLNISVDTLLWLNYLCHQAEVNFIPYNITKNKSHILKGYDCLMQSYILSSRKGYDYYKGVSMKLLSKYMLNDSIFAFVKDFDAASIRYINEDLVPDSLLAGNLAERALSVFLDMNDMYQTADGWRNLALCYFIIGDATRSMECLNMALANPSIDSVPALKANIVQQMSMSYSALDDKHNSDICRNMYLDLQDSTRQDKKLEARVLELEESSTKIWYAVGTALLLFVLLCLLTVLLNRLRKRKVHNIYAADEELEAMEDKLRALALQYSDTQRLAVEQRARVSVINGMLPLIDRMRIAVSKKQYDYARELAEAIELQNDMLTRWIKLRQGSIAPKIETVSVQQIFNIVGQNAKNLELQGTKLELEPTNVNVKADRVLTLFLVNTIVDNARKAVAKGNGYIEVKCSEDSEQGYAEISVADNGKGIEEKQLETLFEYKPIINNDSNLESHGFGLQNCRGVIDKYRKMSSLFSVCTIKAESVVGGGTKISFRLPLVVKMLTLFLCMTLTSVASDVVRFADSLYYCNVNGRYADAMLYADSCNSIIKNSKGMDDRLVLSVYNETAVAALALHDWNKYLYYNFQYAKLYKECTKDKSLPDYCRRLEKNKFIANVAMFVVLFLILLLVPVFWFTYLRHIIKYHKDTRKRRNELSEEISKISSKYESLHMLNNITDNQLSTIKHETMYYPSRIKQMIDHINVDDIAKEQIEGVVAYYREIYAMFCMQALNKQTAAYNFPVAKYSVRELFPSTDTSRLPDGVAILANKELFIFLRLLLKRHNKGKYPSCTAFISDAKYVDVQCVMDCFEYSESAVPELFTPSTVNVDFLVMRQILRETGETSLHYGCGINASVKSSGVMISMTVPRG